MNGLSALGKRPDDAMMDTDTGVPPSPEGMCALVFGTGLVCSYFVNDDDLMTAPPGYYLFEDNASSFVLPTAQPQPPSQHAQSGAAAPAAPASLPVPPSGPGAVEWWAQPPQGLTLLPAPSQAGEHPWVVMGTRAQLPGLRTLQERFDAIATCRLDDAQKEALAYVKSDKHKRVGDFTDTVVLTHPLFEGALKEKARAPETVLGRKLFSSAVQVEFHGGGKSWLFSKFKTFGFNSIPFAPRVTDANRKIRDFTIPALCLRMLEIQLNLP